MSELELPYHLSGIISQTMLLPRTEHPMPGPDNKVVVHGYSIQANATNFLNTNALWTAGLGHLRRVLIKKTKNKNKTRVLTQGFKECKQLLFNVFGLLW